MQIYSDVPSEASHDFTVGVQVRPYNWLMRRARQSKGLTQAALGELVGCSQIEISSLETLRIGRAMSWDVLDRVAAILGQPVTRLFPVWFTGCIVREALLGELPVAVSHLDAAGGTDVIQGIIQAELAQTLYKCLATLPARTRELLVLKFGLNGAGPMTNVALARHCGISRERVRHLCAVGLDKLRTGRYAKGLREYLED